MSNVPDFDEAKESVEECVQDTAQQVETFVREHPAIAVLGAIGIGCAVGLLAKMLVSSPPPPPKNRALQVLEDIQHRLSDLVSPAYDKASHYAEDGASAVKKGVDHLHDLHLGKRLKNLFN